ncbi:hypothetical protein FLP10_02380 [Agromyces intestinalis]|uniref:Uncharacterized protein n=1 Tax=Agromyces intestinalis TaxID=2592652 RepID=A0A5C1YEE0_9MICO|nr:hypothetical protein [Agromyces intestinalis]QEO13389.1 hypothetical protein FLP10_02380 [Agromyces intestinalis]
MSINRAFAAQPAPGADRARRRARSSRSLSRIAAAVVSAALGLGVALVGVAAPAAAHTGNLHADAVCNPATGEYDVTYTLTLEAVPGEKQGTTMWRIGTTEFESTPRSNAGMDRGPVISTGNQTVELGTQKLPGTTKTGPWVYAFTSWGSTTKGSDGRVQNLPGDCVATPSPSPTPTPAPVLEVATGLCEADVPRIHVRATVPSTTAESKVSLVITDGTDEASIELPAPDANGLIDATPLWPGASVDDETGEPTGWPGWKQRADGTWEQTDENFAWTRDAALQAYLDVSREALVDDLVYPAFTLECSANPGIGGGDGGAVAPPTPTPTPAAVSPVAAVPSAGGSGLAETGFAGGTIAIVAGVIVVVGAAVVVIAAVRRKRTVAATTGESTPTE